MKQNLSIIEILLYKIVNQDDVFQQKARKLGLFACFVAGSVPFAHIIFTIYLLVEQKNPSGVIVENKRIFGILVEGILYCSLFTVGFILSRIYRNVSDTFASVYFACVSIIWFGVAITVPFYFVRENCVTIAAITAFSCNNYKFLIILLCFAIQLFSIVNDSIYDGKLISISYFPIKYERMIYLIGGIICGFCAVLGVHFQLVAHNHQITLAKDELDLMTQILLYLTSLDTESSTEIIENNREKIRDDVYFILKSIIELFNAVKKHVSPVILNAITEKDNKDDNSDEESETSNIDKNRDEFQNKEINVDVNGIKKENNEVVRSNPMSEKIIPEIIDLEEQKPNVSYMAKIVCNKLSYVPRNNIKIVISTIELENETDDVISEILKKISNKGGDTISIFGDVIESTWNITSNLTQPYLKSSEIMIDIKKLCSNKVTIYLDSGTVNCIPIKNINDNYTYKISKITHIPRQTKHKNKIIASDNFATELDGKLQCFYFGIHNITNNCIITMEDMIDITCIEKKKYLCYIIKKIENVDDEWMYQLESSDNSVSSKSLEYVRTCNYKKWSDIRKTILL
jgi:hypothetical protein